MNKTIRLIIGLVTLGISEIAKAIQDNKKCAFEYIYTPKKNSCCKHRSKCGLWNYCYEDSKSCKEAHEKHQDPCNS